MKIHTWVELDIVDAYQKIGFHLALGEFAESILPPNINRNGGIIECLNKESPRYMFVENIHEISKGNIVLICHNPEYIGCQIIDTDNGVELGILKTP